MVLQLRTGGIAIFSTNGRSVCTELLGKHIAAAKYFCLKLVGRDAKLRELMQH